MIYSRQFYKQNCPEKSNFYKYLFNISGAYYVYLSYSSGNKPRFPKQKNILYVTPIRFQHNLALKEDSVQMYNVSPVAHSSGQSLRRTFEYPLNFVLQKIFSCFFFRK